MSAANGVGYLGVCKLYHAAIRKSSKDWPNKTASQNIVQLETDVIFFVNFNQYGHTNTLDTNK
jgi:hypothetical protein